MKMKRRRYDDPNMSDATILMKVEDLINIAMGPPNDNIINYKMVQTVLHILARQMRMLETEVEIRISEISPTREKGKKKRETRSSDNSPTSPKASAKTHDRTKGKVSDMRAKDKTERATSKDRERYGKEADKADHALKGREKIDKHATKDIGKAQRAEMNEQERADKEKGKTDKAAAKERKKDARALKDKGKGRAPSATSIVVSEKQGHKDKVLVDSRTRVGSIEVVTISQFELLEATVKKLKNIVGPLPTPALPDNQKLRDELVKGTASLTDTMQAMQLTARIQAAEQAISCMADLITQLAASGAIPESLVDIVEEVKAGVEGTVAVAAAAAAGVTDIVPHPSIAARKSVAIDSKAIHPSQTRLVDTTSRKSIVSRVSTLPGMASQPSTVAASRSVVSTRPSMVSGQLTSVSHKEMDDALQTLREDITKKMDMMNAKAAAAAETAVNTAKAASNKSDIATKLDNRITTLNSLVSDYADQLTGFDSGLTTQMQSFQEQIAQMRSDLKGGLTLLEQANNNAETAAVIELKERYEGLVSELDITLHTHQGLTNLQKQLEDQLRSIVERVEMLQEEKADRDEVLDGLRDKADISRLAGLLTEWDFGAARAELERRLELCHDKFKKQEMVWLGAIKDLTEITENKAEIMQLLAMRDDAQQQLREIHEKINQLSDILGEPKAAIITRILSRDATCGACMMPALMEQTDINFGAPPPLPALRPRPTGAPSQLEKPCVEDWRPSEPPDSKAHTCHRWVGGSHTLLSDAVTRELSEPMQLHAPPTKRFTGYGTDGRLYMMEEELQPCVECNVIDIEKNADEPAEGPRGSGDRDQGARLSLTSNL